MYKKREDRAPGKARGLHTQNQLVDTSVWISESFFGNRVTFLQRQIFRDAADTRYSPSEPSEVTDARSEIEVSLDVARHMQACGLPALVPAHIVEALRYAGRVS